MFNLLIFSKVNIALGIRSPVRPDSFEWSISQNRCRLIFCHWLVSTTSIKSDIHKASSFVKSAVAPSKDKKKISIKNENPLKSFQRNLSSVTLEAHNTTVSTRGKVHCALKYALKTWASSLLFLSKEPGEDTGSVCSCSQNRESNEISIPRENNISVLPVTVSPWLWQLQCCTQPEATALTQAELHLPLKTRVYLPSSVCVSNYCLCKVLQTALSHKAVILIHKVFPWSVSLFG